MQNTAIDAAHDVMLCARNLNKSFGAKKALDDVSFDVRAHEVFCLLGANGAGKTTTLRLFLGQLSPDSGAASVAGFDVNEDRKSALDRIAYVPDDVALYPVLTGLENLEFFSRLAGQRLSKDEIDAILDEVGLDRDAARRRLGGYSKGMRQKVGIAIARARNAAVILLDEPTTGLDPKAAHDFALLVRRLKANGAAILTTTHDLPYVIQVADRIGIMRDGRMLEILKSESLTQEALAARYLDLMEE